MSAVGEANAHPEERRVAVAAVRRAAEACRGVARTLAASDAIVKGDKSPVTVADFASQAVVGAALSAAFPSDALIAEEDSAALRDEAGLLDRTRAAVAAALGREVTADEVLAWIDRGGSDRPAGRRFWTLDPIDGTKGFLRGGQYAVALALLDASGRLEVGVLGCPNLDDGAGGTGAMLVAVRGGGAWSLPAQGDTEPTRLRVRDLVEPAEARLCESVESAHSDHKRMGGIARALGVTADPFRIDSQAKYAAVARGSADLYLRLPTRPDYCEKIWDHAAGALIVQEAGGVVSDLAGNPLDFSRGSRLPPACGIVASAPGIHAAVVAAASPLRADRPAPDWRAVTLGAGARG